METNIALIGIAITLILQLLAGVWWAATINANVRHLSNNLKQINMNHEIRADKQDQSLEAMWKKHDSLDKRVTIVETKCVEHHQRA